MAALLLVLTLCPGAALAAEAGGIDGAEPAAGREAQAQNVPTTVLYPVEVQEYTEDDTGELRISKTYALTPAGRQALRQEYERLCRMVADGEQAEVEML